MSESGRIDADLIQLARHRDHPASPSPTMTGTTAAATMDCKRPRTRRAREMSRPEQAGWVQGCSASAGMTPRQIAHRIQTPNIEVKQFNPPPTVTAGTGMSPARTAHLPPPFPMKKNRHVFRHRDRHHAAGRQEDFPEAGEDIADAPINVNRIAPEDMLGVRRIDPRHTELRVNRGTAMRRGPRRIQLGGVLRALRQNGHARLFRHAHRPVRPAVRRNATPSGSARWVADAVGWRYERSTAAAEIVGDDWSTEGYTNPFRRRGERPLVGLVIDQRTQGMLTDAARRPARPGTAPLKGKPEG